MRDPETGTPLVAPAARARRRRLAENADAPGTTDEAVDAVCTS
ncbi:hypothetical protein [Frankia sp. Mgl5]|nr:hypothetical protein [Frankia sp. Mgl5]